LLTDDKLNQFHIQPGLQGNDLVEAVLECKRQIAKAQELETTWEIIEIFSDAYINFSFQDAKFKVKYQDYPPEQPVRLDNLLTYLRERLENEASVKKEEEIGN
jgi:hypothetical protein